MEERQPVSELTSELPRWDATQTRILDAADTLIERRGVHGVSIVELARRAQLSRPTIYRNWGDADEIVRAALLRRVSGILANFPTPATTRDALVDDVMRFLSLFRADEVYRRLLAEEPEAFTRYTLQRVGSSQRLILQWLAASVSAAQSDGSVRRGRPQEIAVMLLLITQSALLSHGTVSDLIDEAGWQRELRAAVDGHLRP